MLPTWLNDIGTLVTIITGMPIILGWILSWMGKEPGPSPPTQPVRYKRITLRGSIRDGVFQSIIQLEIPVWIDALRAIFATTVLLFIAVLYVRNKMLPIELQSDQPLSQITSFLMFVFGMAATFLWARTFIKIDYLNQQ